MKKLVSGHSAHRSVSRNLLTAREGQKGNTMRTARLAAIAALIPVFSFTLGCGGVEDGEAVTPITVNVSVSAEVCNSNLATLPSFCTQGLKLTVSHTQVDDGSMNPKKNDAEFSFAFAAGEAEDSKTLSMPGAYTAAFEGLEGSGYKPTYNGGLNFDGKVTFEQGTTNLKFVIEEAASGSTGPKTGSVTLVAVDPEENDVADCGFAFHSDHLASVCAIDPAGATCEEVAAASYLVDVSCNSGTLVAINYPFDVVAGEDNTITVPVAPPGSTGTGTGNACFTAIFGETLQSTDVKPCTITADGKSVEPVDPPSGVTCEGVYAEGLTAKSSNFRIACPNGYGDELTTEVEANKVNDIEFILMKPTTPPTNGSVCLSSYDANGDPIDFSECAVDIKQIANDPAPSTPPAGIDCGDANQAYIGGLSASGYTFVVTCGTASGQASATITAGGHVSQDVFVYEPVPDGDLCSVDHAFIADAYTFFVNSADAEDPFNTVLTVDLEGQIGLGVGGGCSPSAIADKTDITFVSLTGPGCSALGESGCRLAPRGASSDPLVNGVHQHMLWTADMDGMAPGDLEIYVIGIEDAGTGQSMTRSFWVYNGDALDL